MRLVIVAATVVAGFVIGAWGIVRLVPVSPEWLRVTLVMVWLFALIFAGLLLGNKERRRWKREDQRRLLEYGLLTAVLIAAALVPISMYKMTIPRVFAWVIFAAIAGAVLSLSKFVEHRLTIEEAFDITISDQDAEAIQTPHDLIEWLLPQVTDLPPNIVAARKLKAMSVRDNRGDLLVKPNEPWRREQVAAIVREIIVQESGTSTFDENDKFEDDIFSRVARNS